MLPEPYFLQDETKILMFEENFATSVAVDLCGQGHTKRLQQQQRDSPAHGIPLAKLTFMQKMSTAPRRDAPAAGEGY